MAAGRFLSLILVRGRTVDDFDHLLLSFLSTQIGDTWEASSWAEAELALRGDVKAACESEGWLCILDAEARLPYERSSCMAISDKFESTVFALISDEERDFHYFGYHSKERSRTMLCTGGQAQEETGLALFQETGLGLCASGTAGMLDLMRRVAFEYDRMKEAKRFVLKRVYQPGAEIDPSDGHP